jgi:N-carbamoylputrescine amidase
VKVTVCQMPDEPIPFAREWDALVAHAKTWHSELVVLPEMPFAPWFARERQYQEDVWQAAVSAHQEWLARLVELSPATVIGTRPVTAAAGRRNSGFIWSLDGGLLDMHYKSYLPDEDGFWEASWYGRGSREFTIARLHQLNLGILVCTELWFLEQARFLGRAGAHLIITPRATQFATREKWLVGGRAAAVVAGAYQLSSNRTSTGPEETRFGDWGWIIDPDGEVLGLTSREAPFLTLEIDLAAAERAKRTYPRYVEE